MIPLAPTNARLIHFRNANPGSLQYHVELFMRVVTASLQTLKIVCSLPLLDI